MFEYMCPKCKAKLDILAEMGKCAECGEPTNSRSFKLCVKCAAKLQQCEQCRNPLTPSASPSPSASSTTATAEPPKVAPKKLDFLVHGKIVTATVNQELVLELRGAQATPWEVIKVDGPSVQQVGKVEFKPKAEGATDGTYTATFKAGKEGKTTIQLQAPIEAGKKDKMEIKFTVTVTAAGT